MPITSNSTARVRGGLLWDQRDCGYEKYFQELQERLHRASRQSGILHDFALIDGECDKYQAGKRGRGACLNREQRVPFGDRSQAQLLSRLDAKHGAFFLVSDHVQQAVGALANVADALAKFA